jgi:hypothetical protein
MLTFHSRAIALRRITMVFGVGSLMLSGLAAVSPPGIAKEKYTIDPVTGTKYKPEPEMKELLMAWAALGGKPIERLTPTEARLQPAMADAVNALAGHHSCEAVTPAPGDHHQCTDRPSEE